MQRIKLLIILLFLFFTQIVYSQGVMFRRIMIDPGHGGYDGGSPGRNGDPAPNESDINLNVGLYLKNTLLNQLAQVQMTRSSDVYVSKYTRQNLINAQLPEAMVSIHMNSSSNPEVQGTETFWYKDSLANGKSLASYIQDDLLMIGYADRGVKKKAYVVLNVKKEIAATLTEPLFISEQDGWYKMTFSGGIIGTQQVATYINNGLIHFFDGSTYPSSNLDDFTLDWQFDPFPFIHIIDFTWGSGGNKNKTITYSVLSSDDPYLPINQWNVEVQNTTATTFEDSIDVESKFYCIEMNENSTLTYSEKLGYLKKDCNTTSGKDLNLVSMPLFESNYESVSDLGSKYQDRIESVSKWDATNQKWYTACNSFLGWIDDFDIEENAVYMINITDYIEFFNTGHVYEQDEYYLQNNSNGSCNLITLPLRKDSLNTTELFGDDIGTCNSISEWNNSNQSWITSEYAGTWSNIFNTYIGFPYIADVSTNTYYPQSKKDFITGIKATKSAEVPNTPRKIVYHVVDSLSNELTDISDISFEAFIKSRPDEIQSSTTEAYAKIDTLNNMLFISVNAGNFETDWNTDDIMQIEVTQISTGYKGRVDVQLDDCANAIIKGFEAISPGTGNPIKLTAFGSSQLQIASINDSSNDIIIKWHPLSGVESYQVYSSDEPYNNFTLDLSGSFNDTTWTGSLTQDKKFYYVIGINSDKGYKAKSGTKKIDF